MPHLRRLDGVSALALASALAALPAFAEDWTVDGSVAVGAAVQDNLYADADQRVSDLVLTLAPALSWSLERDGAAFRAYGDALIGAHAANDEEDYVDARLGLSAGKEFGLLRVFGGLEHAWRHETRASPEDAFGIEPVTYTRLGGNAGAEIDLAPFTLRLGALTDRFDFDDVTTASGAVIDGDRRDRTETELGLRLSRDLTDRGHDALGVFVQGALDLRDYDETIGVDRDAAGWSAAVGLTGRLAQGGFGTLDGELLAGIMTLDRQDPALKDLATPDLGADLVWRPEPGTALHAVLERSLEETTVTLGGTPASGYVATALRLRAERAASERLRLGVWGGIAEQDFAGIDRTDRILSFGVDARYQLTERVWISPALLHEQRRSDVAGEEYAAQSAMLRIGADLAPAWEGAAPPPYAGVGQVYAGAQTGIGVFATSQSGPRGGGRGTVEGSYATEAVAGGVFAGWRSVSNGIVLGAEAEVELAEAGWRHFGDRDFSVRRGPLAGVALIGGMELAGGGIAYVRGGPVVGRLTTDYGRNGQTAHDEETRVGARMGVGIETPVSGALSLRTEALVTAWDDHRLTAGGGAADRFAETEAQGRVGVVWRFGGETEAPALAVDFSGPYAGLRLISGGFASRDTGDRTGFTLDADRGAIAPGAGVYLGWGETFGPFYAGVEAEAEISSAGWSISRDPTGRTYDLEKPWSAGVAARLGVALNDGALVYVRGGVSTAGLEADYATSGTAASDSWRRTGITYGIGLEAAATERMRVRVEYVRTDWDDVTLGYGAGRSERFDPTEGQIRAGISWAF